MAGREVTFPEIITIWHYEPGGKDAGTVCSERKQRKDGSWYTTRRWPYHVHHWRVRVPVLTELRRYLLTRCSVCGGKSRRGNPVNVSGWQEQESHFWQGEKGLSHSGCYARENFVPPEK